MANLQNIFVQNQLATIDKKIFRVFRKIVMVESLKLTDQRTQHPDEIIPLLQVHQFLIRRKIALLKKVNPSEVN